MGLWTYDFAEQHIQIVPYEKFGEPADYSAKIEAAKKVLGSKWCLYRAPKVVSIVRKAKVSA